MCFVSGKMSKKFWNIVKCHVINATLHGTKQVMVKLMRVNSLVERKVIYLLVPQMVKCEDADDHLKHLGTLLWVISNNFHRSVIALYNQGASPKHSRISMRVKLQTGF
jgi:hypothetical protein